MRYAGGPSLIRRALRRCRDTAGTAVGLWQKGTDHPAAGAEVSIPETADPPLGCIGLLRLISALRVGREMVFVPEASCRFRAASAIE